MLGHRELAPNFLHWILGGIGGHGLSKQKPPASVAGPKLVKQRFLRDGLQTLDRVKQWAGTIKQDAVALYFAARDPRTSWYAKGLAVFVVAYALSPIDLVPDFIPVLGYLDDLLIVPIGLWIVVSLIPNDVMEEYRLRSASLSKLPTSKTAFAIIVLTWFVLAVVTGWLVYKTVHTS